MSQNILIQNIFLPYELKKKISYKKNYVHFLFYLKNKTVIFNKEPFTVNDSWFDLLSKFTLLINSPLSVFSNLKKKNFSLTIFILTDLFVKY